MTNQHYLKELERKAFRSTYQDGIWDIYLGIIVFGIGIFVSRPDEGYMPLNFILLLLVFTVAYLLFWAGKKFITTPRMGQVTFGAHRQQRKKTLSIVLALVVILQVAVVLLSAAGWVNKDFGLKLSTLLGGGSMERLVVATIGSLFIGPSMILVAYFKDFPRGYYIAILMALAVFLMIMYNQPLYTMVIGGMIMIPGFVLFIRFLRRYPLNREEA